MSKRLLIVAGEASGDLHGARLLDELRKIVPDFAAYGLGGEQLRSHGVEQVADVSAISVVGVAEVLRVLPRAKRIFRSLIERVRADPPDLAILIDFPEFNLRLAPALRDLNVPVFYYVSPQVWAWRKGRIRSMARSIDKMLVFFPFEVDFYRGRLDVVHVGHPLVDEVPVLDQVWASAGAADPPKIVLLPGSRTSEVKRLLPVLLQSVGELRARYPELEATLIQAATVESGVVERLVAESGVEIRRAPEADRYRQVAAAHLALCASGTATLEVGLLGTPMIVVYRIGLFSYWLGRWIVDVPHISLVNLVLGEEIVPELIQGDARAEKIAAEARSILEDEERRERMQTGLAGLRPALGRAGASARAASQVAAFLNRGPA